MSTVILKPVDGRRLVVPAGCRTLDGVPLPMGTDLPKEGAIVPRQVWAIRAIGRGDAAVVEEPPAAAEPAVAKPSKAPTPINASAGSAPSGGSPL